MTIKKEMINRNNPERELRYIVIAEVNGKIVQAESPLDFDTMDPDPARVAAKAASLATLGLA